MKIHRTTDLEGELDKLKDVVQDSNLNFLLGSGLSSPYLSILSNIESLLTAAEVAICDEEPRSIVIASLYKHYFLKCIADNKKILASDAGYEPTHRAYCSFITTLNLLLHRRENSILGRQANLFTTNIDICLERALEACSVEYTDGFAGSFDRSFDIGHYRRSSFRRSLQFDNLSEVPVFNLVKLHGSLTWQAASDTSIRFSADLNQLATVAACLPHDAVTLPITSTSEIGALLADAKVLGADPSLQPFVDEFLKVPIVNPTNAKFNRTLLDRTYYGLLRMFANELEKENTVLFAMGFSFSDDHICELAVKAANSNPTLLVYVFAHSSISAATIEANLNKFAPRNSNIILISPPLIAALTPPAASGTTVDEYNFDLPSITVRVFDAIVPERAYRKRGRYEASK